MFSRSSLLLVLFAVLAPNALADDGRPVVYTTFYPTTYFTQRIAGDLATVVNPCPPDADPALWSPDAKTIEAYQKAALIVINGAQFEKWVDKAALPQSRIVDTTRPLKDELITLKDAVRHSHGKSGEHTHEGIDGHTWLDPVNAKVQAGQIRDALVKLLPGHKAALDANYDALAKDLDGLDARFKAIAERIKDQQLLGNHPVWNYVARRYGLKIETFALDPGAAPSDETLVRLREFLFKTRAKHMLWEEQPAEAAAKPLTDEFGLRHIVFDPAEALHPVDAKAGRNYLKIMNDNIDRLGAIVSRP